MAAQRRAVAVGHGQPGSRQGAQRQLVAVVGLGPAVPVEVVGAERGDGHDRGGRGQIGGLEARDLDHPEVELVAGHRVPGRAADVAGHHGPEPEAAQEVPGHRGGGGLALGAGDAGHPVEIGLLEPQAEAAGDDHPGGLQGGHLGTGPADARGLDDDVAVLEGRKAPLGGGQHRQTVELAGGGAVVDQHRGGAEGLEAGQVGPALDPEAPEPDRGRTAEVRPADRRARRHRGCSARPPGPAARRPGPRRRRPGGARPPVSPRWRCPNGPVGPPPGARRPGTPPRRPRTRRASPRASCRAGRGTGPPRSARPAARARRRWPPARAGTGTGPGSGR